MLKWSNVVKKSFVIAKKSNLKKVASWPLLGRNRLIEHSSAVACSKTAVKFEQVAIILSFVCLLVLGANVGRLLCVAVDFK